MIKIYHEYHELSWKLTIFDVIQSHCVIKEGDTIPPSKPWFTTGPSHLLFTYGEIYFMLN